MLVWIFREHMHAGPQARTGDGPAYKGGVSNGRNGRQDGKCGNARSTRNVGGRHGEHTVLRVAQRPLGAIRFDAEFDVIYPSYTYWREMARDGIVRSYCA